jgi:hypothetical protein
MTLSAVNKAKAAFFCTAPGIGRLAVLHDDNTEHCVNFASHATVPRAVNCCQGLTAGQNGFSPAV